MGVWFCRKVRVVGHELWRGVGGVHLVVSREGGYDEWFGGGGGVTDRGAVFRSGSSKEMPPWWAEWQLNRPPGGGGWQDGTSGGCDCKSKQVRLSG